MWGIAAAVVSAVIVVAFAVWTYRAHAQGEGKAPNLPRKTSPYSAAKLDWSGNPGCFETHLKRKHDNPLFPESERAVSQQQIDEARDRDLRDAAELRERFREIAAEIMHLPEQAAFTEILSIRVRVDQLLEDAASVGGDAASIRESLMPIRESVVGSIREAIENSEDREDLLETLDEAEAYYRSETALSCNPFIAQVWRLPVEDVIPTLLSEPPESIRAIMSAFGEDKRPVIAAEARALLLRARSEGLDVPQADEKLKALGSEAG